ncbi:albusnodin/ikarugamycin family macrolactam cyclase [Streptomyces sp. NPDC021100]|uniref:albusnodin/ikarugamycin family macrolactam cyclase n=1 Tax=Streptomyces sp. NPDC021100 TaxID=3365114 RepID=UPI0037AD6318
MRLIAGRHGPGNRGGGVRLRGGREIKGLPGTRIWASGHEAGEVRTASSPGGAVLVTAGCCLATQQELTGAVAALERGDFARATRLPGSYLTVARTQDGMRVAGDQAGAMTVYWLPLDGQVLWATAAVPLAAVTGAQADLSLLLGSFMLTGVDILADHSLFHGVRRVPPGHALALPDHGPARTTPARETVPSLSPGEGGQRMRAALQAAVGRRAQAAGRLSADLSGGIDSSSITCLAATSRPLLAVTYTDAHLADDDDPRYARRLADTLPGITHRVVNGRDGDGHFAGLEDTAELPRTDTPSFTLGLLTLKDAQLAPVIAHGSSAHLTGRGGDDVLDAVRSHPVDLYLAGHRIEALRRAAGYARARRSSVHRMWGELLRTAATGYPQALAALAASLGRPPAAGRPYGATPWEAMRWCSTTGSAPWLTRGGRRALSVLVETRAAQADPYVSPARLHERLGLELMADGHATFDTIARIRWGIPLHAPFLDTAIVDAALAIAPGERIRPGVYKALARTVFDGLVPDFLLHRPTKTTFSSSVYAGLRRHAPALRGIISGSALARAGLLDLRRVLEDLERAVQGVPAPLAGLHALVVTELWLTLLDTARHTWWERDEEDVPCP